MGEMHCVHIRDYQIFEIKITDIKSTFCVKYLMKTFSIQLLLCFK